MISFEVIVSTIVALLTLTLWFFLRFAIHAKANLFFRLVVLSCFFWTLSIIATLVDPNPAQVVLWSRFSFFFPLLMVELLHPFVYFFAPPITRSHIFHKISYFCSTALFLIGLYFAYLCFTPTILKDVVNLHSQFGPLQPVYGLYMFTSFLAILILFWKAARSSKGKLRAQYQFMLLGIGASSFCAILTNIFIPFFGLGEIRVLGPIGLIFFLAATSYAIIAHRLFDIRIIIKRTIMYSGLWLASFGIYTASVLVFATLFGQETALNARSFTANILAALFIAASFNPLRHWLQTGTEKFLFKREYEQQSVLKELADKLNGVSELDEAVEAVMQTLVKVFHLQHAATFIFQRGENGQLVVKRIKQVGYRSSANLFLEDKDFVISYFTENPGIVVVEDLEQQLIVSTQLFKKSLEKHPSGESSREQAIKTAVHKKLDSFDSAVVVPLHINQQLAGLILLSQKMSQEDYNHEDLALIDLVGAQAISSIEKAKLYEDDQTKNEFVSIASHELLTPVSAIEGYLSMILDENLGHVDTQAREYLTKVYTSAKRLSVLIKDILSVSRIEANRLKVEPQSLEIEKLILETIDQLKFVAEEKKLKLTYIKPVEPLPPVWADPDRTMQVLINLVSNAIKYTSKGSITVLASHPSHSQNISVEVRDTGMGIPKREQTHMFEKFYRVDSPETTGIIGTGLGLYITKSILEKMGGSISLKSSPGDGTSFTFTLPVFRVELSKLD